MTSIPDTAAMFVHTGANLPEHHDYPADLAKLGYQVNDGKEKQIVSISPEPHFFTYFHTSNPDVNDMRKEAMHESVRGLVMMELAALGVVQVYLGGEKGTEILGEGAKGKPQEKHIPILATKLEELKGKRDVIVVIGEPNDDLGIWAWRHLMQEGGIEGGSAVGLVNKLAVLGIDSTAMVYEEEMKKKREMGSKVLASMPPTGSGHSSGAQSTARRDSITAGENNKVPGVIILNPGARLWSNKVKHTMTVSTWLARKRLNALGEQHVVDPVHNLVEGHTAPDEHIETCMDSILPQILREDAQLYVVGITTSAEYFINWYQARQCTTGTPHGNHTDVPGIVKKLSAYAFMHPTHDATKIKCDTVEIMLHNFGRQWIKSSEPLGKFLNTVKPTEPPALPSFPHTNSEAEDDVLLLPDYESAYPETGAGTTALPAPENEPGSQESAGATKRRPLFELGDEESSDEEGTHLSYDHHREIVSCPTYSGETDVDELIWPHVMDLALGHFKFMAEKTARPWAY